MFYYAFTIPEQAKGNKAEENKFIKKRLTELIRDGLTLAKKVCLKR